MTIPFDLNGKPGVLEVYYDTNRSLTASGFDLLAGCGFDVNMCLGYPTMRDYVRAYEGTGYYTASAWIQIIIRREFAAIAPNSHGWPTLFWCRCLAGSTITR